LRPDRLQNAGVGLARGKARRLPTPASQERRRSREGRPSPRLPSESQHGQNPVVDAPIVGATTEHHLSAAAAALDVALAQEEIAALEQPYAMRAATYF
jgi:hypothetical protein